MESALSAGAGKPGLKLIETLSWTGQEFPRLGLHLARLAHSAGQLGWGCDLGAVEAALRQAAPGGTARMRLTLDAGGTLEVQTAAMPPGKPEWRIGLAPMPLRSDDPWLRVKTTQRPAYDTARAALSPGLDEVIFLNERGEVCDGTITTVFFDRGQGMRTPPLTCGLLPGVLRAELTCPEEVLRGDDLPQVRLWVGNSLRGLIPAVFVGALPDRLVR